MHLTCYRDALERRGRLASLVVEGETICVCDEGAGPPMVLLHGLCGSLYDWRMIAPAMADRGYRVIRPDLLGAGESSKPRTADYTPAAQARRVRTLLDRLGIERAVLAGNSYGGGIALALASRWPERVDRMVLINPICYPDRPPPQASLSRLRWFAETFGSWVPVRWLAKRLLPGDAAAVRGYTCEIRAPGRRETIIRTLRSQAVPRPFNHIRVPTLILWGAKDQTIPLAFGRRLAGELPRASLSVIAEAGHLPNQEVPHVVVDRMAAFLSAGETRKISRYRKQ